MRTKLVAWTTADHTDLSASKQPMFTMRPQKAPSKQPNQHETTSSVEALRLSKRKATAPATSGLACVLESTSRLETQKVTTGRLE